MDSATNIFLVGMMGAGKTSIGKQLARHLKLSFIDTDHVIEADCGVDIPLIFEIEGTAGFRKREARVIAALTEKRDVVLATGGGAVLDAGNRANLTRNGVVVYLSAPPELLLERLRKDKKRPLLQVDDRLAQLRELHAERDPLYREIAHVVVEVAGQSPHQLARFIEGRIRLSPASQTRDVSEPDFSNDPTLRR